MSANAFGFGSDGLQRGLFLIRIGGGLEDEDVVAS